MVLVLFCLLAVVAVLAGALVFVVDSMARASYLLALSFTAVAAGLLILGLEYIGVVTILMMIMEMAIMAVYMIMFMGMNPALMPMSMVHGQRPALVVSILLFAALSVGILLAPWPDRPAPAPATIDKLGTSMMGPQMLVMITISPIMLAAIVGGITLASAQTRYDRFGDDLDRSGPALQQPGGKTR